MKKCALIAGGYRIGDSCHMIPLLRKLSQDYEIDWFSGEYAKEVSFFLKNNQNLNIKSLFIYPERRKPGDINDRNWFVDSILEPGREKLNLKDYDYVITDVRASFEVAYNYKDYIGNYPELTYLDLSIERKSENYICVQPDSISVQKRFTRLSNLCYKLPVFSMGCINELKIPNSNDFRGISFQRTAELMYQARFNVAIHSSLACLSFYLNKPTIICHFQEGQFKFGKYHENCLDLIQPTEEQLNEAMDTFLQKY